MNIHNNARLTVFGRKALVFRIREGMSQERVAQHFGVSRRTSSKWLNRFRGEGEEGLQDRTSAPHRSPRRISQELVERILHMRKDKCLMRDIAKETSVSLASVSRILKRAGYSSLESLEEKPVVVRYERSIPGELVHIDIKQLGKIIKPGHRITKDLHDTTRGAGWEYVHVAVDDHSRFSFAEVFSCCRQGCAIEFLKNTIRIYRRFGISISSIMTDNGAAYRSKRFRRFCAKLKIKQIFTRPYTPRTNGKAERFIQTMTKSWAYAARYENSDLRAQALPSWLAYYNINREHAGIGMKTPLSRVIKNENNVLKTNS